MVQGDPFETTKLLVPRLFSMEQLLENSLAGMNTYNNDKFKPAVDACFKQLAIKSVFEANISKP